jgi:hypothetical protein
MRSVREAEFNDVAAASIMKYSIFIRIKHSHTGNHEPKIK